MPNWFQSVSWFNCTINVNDWYGKWISRFCTENLAGFGRGLSFFIFFGFISSGASWGKHLSIATLGKRRQKCQRTYCTKTDVLQLPFSVLQVVQFFTSRNSPVKVTSENPGKLLVPMYDQRSLCKCEYPGRLSQFLDPNWFSTLGA